VKTERPTVHYAHRTLESGGQHKARESSGIVYRIVVREELSERFAVAFEGMEMKTRSGQTVLTGEIIDQPQLHGILTRIGSLGLELLRVEALPDDAYPGPERKQEVPEL
jgi:hypothetical protein